MPRSLVDHRFGPNHGPRFVRRSLPTGCHDDRRDERNLKMAPPAEFRPAGTPLAFSRLSQDMRQEARWHVCG
jgi:hypothetical protein